METILVTGGAGFIGSALVRMLINDTPNKIVNVDKLTYAGNLDTLRSVVDNDRHIFEQVDICDGAAIERILSQYRPDRLIHLAAESHVDRSIDGPSEFINTNIVGTYTLLENARVYWKTLSKNGRKNFRFHHVSTDEVYGSLGPGGLFTESTPYRPNSPYSASKASSDHLVRAWWKTYGLPTLISNCSNNYGPYQYPEKMIPLMISKALEGKGLPVYGKGENVRDWLYVEDHVEALWQICNSGRPGEVYNVGGDSEVTNIDVVRRICGMLDENVPRADGSSYESQIEFVQDRPGHDLRYAIDATKIHSELGWTARESFESGLRKTVQWYLDNAEWRSAVKEKYGGQRLGTEA